LVSNDLQPRDVIAVAFHSDGPEAIWTRPRKTFGSVHPKEGSIDENNENIIVFDATVNGSSSGAPVINVKDGLVGGIVVGIPPGAEYLDNTFDRTKNYNQAVIFDNDFKNMFL